MEARRVVFLGNDAWSVPSVEALAASRHEVALVLTRTPRPARRGGGTVPTPVAAAAAGLGLPLVEVDTVKEGPGLEAVREAAPDVLIVVAYGEILTYEVLTVPRLGPVNVHFSLLPALRGASPVRHALLQGLAATGVTTMLMEPGLDEGPILLQQGIPIREDDDAGSLGDRLAALGARLLVETLDGFEELDPIPQNDAAATYAPKLGAEDRRLNWDQDAVSLANRVRAFAPKPGGTTAFRGEPLKVLRARVGVGAGEVERGVVLEASGDALVVGTGGGSLRLLEVAPAGRRRMTSGEFVRGFRPTPGERLG